MKSKSKNFKTKQIQNRQLLMCRHTVSSYQAVITKIRDISNPVYWHLSFFYVLVEFELMYECWCPTWKAKYCSISDCTSTAVFQPGHRVRLEFNLDDIYSNYPKMPQKNPK